MASKEDLKWLENFVQQNNTQPIVTSNTKGEKESVTDFLEQVTEDAPASSLPQTKKQEQLQKKAEKQGVADQERIERERVRQEQKQQEELQQQKEAQQAFAVRVANKTTGAVSSTLAPTVDKIGAMPTVGGIGLLLLILGILLALVVRVNSNGDTRAKQLWYMLTGRASLQGSVRPSGVVNPVQGVNVIPGGASTDFGPASNTTTTTQQSSASSNGANLGTLDLGF
jgi:Fe2+ transport system protein B